MEITEGQRGTCNPIKMDAETPECSFPTVGWGFSKAHGWLAEFPSWQLHDLCHPASLWPTGEPLLPQEDPSPSSKGLP